MKLIKIKPDHFIIVDDSEIKDGDWYWNELDKAIRFNNTINHPYHKKITHSTKPIEQYYGAVDGTIPFVYHKIKPLDLSEVKELIGEVNVEKRSEIIAKSLHDKSKHDDWCIYDQLVYEDKELIKLGYNQAIEDNKEKKYTEAQLIWAIQEAYGHGQNDEFEGSNKIEESIEVITKFLQSKNEWEVEFIEGKLKLKQ